MRTGPCSARTNDFPLRPKKGPPPFQAVKPLPGGHQQPFDRADSSRQLAGCTLCVPPTRRLAGLHHVCACFRLRRPPTASEAFRAAAGADAVCSPPAMMGRRCRTATALAKLSTPRGQEEPSATAIVSYVACLHFASKKIAEHEGFPEGRSRAITFKKTTRCFEVGLGWPWAPTVAIT